MNARLFELVRCHVSPCSRAELIEIFNYAIVNQQKTLVGFANVGKSVDCYDSPRLQRSMSRSDYICCDGFGIKLVYQFLGRLDIERITGIDLFYDFLAECNKSHYSVFFLGATAEVNKELVEAVVNRYPSISRVDGIDGFFDKMNCHDTVKKINEFNPDVLFVGMSSPFKENFLAENYENLTCRFMMGVGGAFDVFVGKVARAPIFFQRCGLEWFYRVVQEPHRIRRNLQTITRFVFLFLVFFIRQNFLRLKK